MNSSIFAISFCTCSSPSKTSLDCEGATGAKDDVADVAELVEEVEEVEEVG